MDEQYVVKDYQVGEVVKGIVTKVEDKQVIVAVENSKCDGIIPISALSSLHVEKASEVVSEGQELELEVTKVEEESLILSKRKVDAAKAWETLYQKFEQQQIIEAEVKDVVKGGLVVDLGVRGFVPASLVEDHFVEDFTDYKGKTLTFKIVEIEKENNRLILSHRAVVQDEKHKSMKHRLEEIQVGQVLEGTVQRLTNFGAFVDIGGVDGLVHISQLSYQHVDQPSDVVAKGDKVKVKVLAVNPQEERISLSIKDTLPGPWDQISEKCAKDTVLEGTVKRIVSFGAFVEVFPGVEGLVHISQISHKHIATPHEVLKEGQVVQVKVLEINEQEQRLSLSMKALEENDSEENFSYELPEETTGFQFSDVIGDQLKKFKK
ncbi:30S ribosomal protein S1 [Bacillus massiliigorillae]|uniref:30S ribosomal protein S1 n=1 Tax=Bacillus massiliigorillae TaxID=1243664 RepID=UPI0003A3E49D|nr:30S ribosomal protein S1 [Bacillus massiliigorillae]